MAAKAATLTFMVGGPTSRFEEAHSILSLMGKNVVHCGDVSTGQVYIYVCVLWRCQHWAGIYICIHMLSTLPNSLFMTPF